MVEVRFRGFQDVVTSWSFHENLVNAAPQRIDPDVRPDFGVAQFPTFTPGILFVIRVEGLGEDDRITLREAGAAATRGVFLDQGLVYVERLSGVATRATGVGQFIYETDARRLWWDADGAGGAPAKQIATLSGIAAFGAAEIILI